MASQYGDCHDGGEGALDAVVERSEVGEVDDAEEAELQVELSALGHGGPAAPQPLALEVGEGAQGGQRQQREAERVGGVPAAAPAVHLVQH